jgi:limonene-1,2-epoxide hydrolase
MANQSDYIAVAKQFFAAWAKQDHPAVLKLIHDDVEYQNMPFTEIMRGKDAIATFMSKFGRGMANIHVDLRNIVQSGNVVFHEGIENYERKGKKVALPYAGVFEFKDGKIIGWRDYFDYATLEKQLAA